MDRSDFLSLNKPKVSSGKIISEKSVNTLWKVGDNSIKYDRPVTFRRMPSDPNFGKISSVSISPSTPAISTNPVVTVEYDNSDGDARLQHATQTSGVSYGMWNQTAGTTFSVGVGGVTGSGVTWDYTTLGGYAGEFRDVEVVAAAATTFAADFPTSVSAIKVGTNLTSYYSSTATERSSQGFVFSEPSLGDVIAQFSANEEIVATYPFAFGNMEDLMEPSEQVSRSDGTIGGGEAAKKCDPTT